MKGQFVKTKMCPFNFRGHCVNENSCTYAHSEVELRPLPDLLKTKLCSSITKNYECKDPKCNYAHTREDLRATADLVAYKTSLCFFHRKGKCLNGNKCRFAHGIDELKAADPPGGNNGGPPASNCSRMQNNRGSTRNVPQRQTVSQPNSPRRQPAANNRSWVTFKQSYGLPAAVCDNNRYDIADQIAARNGNHGCEVEKDAHVEKVPVRSRSLVDSSGTSTTYNNHHRKQPVIAGAAPPPLPPIELPHPPVFPTFASGIDLQTRTTVQDSAGNSVMPSHEWGSAAVNAKAKTRASQTRALQARALQSRAFRIPVCRENAVPHLQTENQEFNNPIMNRVPSGQFHEYHKYNKSNDSGNFSIYSREMQTADRCLVKKDVTDMEALREAYTAPPPDDMFNYKFAGDNTDISTNPGSSPRSIRNLTFSDADSVYSAPPSARRRFVLTESSHTTPTFHNDFALDVAEKLNESQKCGQSVPPLLRPAEANFDWFENVDIEYRESADWKGVSVKPSSCIKSSQNSHSIKGGCGVQTEYLLHQRRASGPMLKTAQDTSNQQGVTNNDPMRIFFAGDQRRMSTPVAAKEASQIESAVNVDGLLLSDEQGNLRRLLSPSTSDCAANRSVQAEANECWCNNTKASQDLLAGDDSKRTDTCKMHMSAPYVWVQNCEVINQPPVLSGHSVVPGTWMSNTVMLSAEDGSGSECSCGGELCNDKGCGVVDEDDREIGDEWGSGGRFDRWMCSDSIPMGSASATVENNETVVVCPTPAFGNNHHQTPNCGHTAVKSVFDCAKNPAFVSGLYAPKDEVVLTIKEACKDTSVMRTGGSSNSLHCCEREQCDGIVGSCGGTRWCCREGEEVQAELKIMGGASVQPGGRTKLRNGSSGEMRLGASGKKNKPLDLYQQEPNILTQSTIDTMSSCTLNSAMSMQSQLQIPSSHYDQRSFDQWFRRYHLRKESEMDEAASYSSDSGSDASIEPDGAGVNDINRLVWFSSSQDAPSGGGGVFAVPVTELLSAQFVRYED